MAEKLFDMIEVRTAANEFGGAASTKGMRGDVNVDIGFFTISMNEPEEGMIR